MLYGRPMITMPSSPDASRIGESAARPAASERVAERFLGGVARHQRVARHRRTGWTPQAFGREPQIALELLVDLPGLHAQREQAPVAETLEAGARANHERQRLAPRAGVRE